MRFQKLSHLVIGYSLILIFLVRCGAPLALNSAPSVTPFPPTDTLAPTTSLPIIPTNTPILPKNTPEPTSCEELEGDCLELYFDGEKCTYEGPSTLKSRHVTLLFLNESEEIAAVGLMRHIGDETIQDMIDYIGEEPSTGISPSWVKIIPTWSPVHPHERYTWEGILEPGIHTMVCSIHWLGLGQHTIWFGGGFKVKD